MRIVHPGEVVRTTIAVIACLLVCAVAFGCGRGGSSEASCDLLCSDIADCFADCDFEEEPDCDEREEYERIKTRCMSQCEPGVEGRGDVCEEAMVDYARCVDAFSCYIQESVECQAEERRYAEHCTGVPGGRVCGEFCTELAIGCFSYTEIGFRGPGCEGQCFEQAQDLSCLEAHYDVADCIAEVGGRRYSCEWVGDHCTSEFATLRERCPGWQQQVADPSELALCEEMGALSCTCDLSTDPIDCEPQIRERCMFQLGAGEACANATAAFSLCMDSIDVCGRDVLRETCQPEWQAWSAACFIPRS